MTDVEFSTAYLALAEKWWREANVVHPEAHPNHIVALLRLSPFGADAAKEDLIGWGKIYRGLRDQDYDTNTAAEMATKEWFEMLPEPGSTNPVGSPALATPAPKTPVSVKIVYYVDGYKSTFTISDVSGRALLQKYAAILQEIKAMGGEPWFEQIPTLPVAPLPPISTTPSPSLTYPPVVPGYPPPQATGPAPTAPICPIHQKAMRRSKHEGGGWYCSVAVGTHPTSGEKLYCDQKVVATF